MLKGTSPSALKEGGYTMGMSLVVLMLTVDTLVPALEPMYGTPFSNTCLQKCLPIITGTVVTIIALLSDHVDEFVLVEIVEQLEGVAAPYEDGLGRGGSGGRVLHLVDAGQPDVDQ